jgi:transketolase
MDINPLKEKWLQFNWSVYSAAGGNDMDTLQYVLSNLAKSTYPSCIILNTIKGKGVSSWENGYYHLMYGDVLKSGVEEWRELLRSKSKVVADAV